MSDNLLAQITEGLTKPVSKVAIALIDKIENAIGKLYEPIGIKRGAKAEAEAAIIQAKAEIEIAKAKAEAAIIQAETEIESIDLQQRTTKEETQRQKNMAEAEAAIIQAEAEVTNRQRRGARRWLAELGRQQENIENTITKAIPQLNEDADPNDVEDDWIIKFFDKCRLITDDKMQDLWASILAGEANRAGSYSPKALTTLADMDQKGLILFNAFCSFCIVYLEDPIAFQYRKSSSNFKIRDARVPIITGSNAFSGNFQHGVGVFAQKSGAIYQRYGFGMSEFLLLLEHGLIQDVNTHTGYSSFMYNDDFWAIKELPSTEGEFQPPRISGYSLSSVGKELFHIAKRSSPPGHFELLIDFLQECYNVKIYRLPKK